MIVPMQAIDQIKIEIRKSNKEPNDFGIYKCGCSMNPGFYTITGLCDKHNKLFKSYCTEFNKKSYVKFNEDGSIR